MNLEMIRLLTKNSMLFPIQTKLYQSDMRDQILCIYSEVTNIEKTVDEPFFAFVSSCLIGAELLRRGVIRIQLLTTKSNTEYISPLSLADNEFEFIEKISSFQLTDDIYHPENNNETEICTSLTNQGLFIKKGNEFHLTEKGTMLIVDIGKNS